MKRLVMLAVMAALLVSLAAPAAFAKIELRMGHVVAATEPTHKAGLMWAEAVKKRTNGEIIIKVFPSAQLGKTATCMSRPAWAPL